MASLSKTHQPCPCGISSDAYSTYEDGHGFCFSCNKRFSSMNENTPKKEGEYVFADWRSIPNHIFKKYNSPMLMDDNKNLVELVLPYDNEHSKIRSATEKSFVSVGRYRPGLFGKSVFPDAKDQIIITEGELDAMSAHFMLGIPAVTPHSASSAVKDCRTEFEYLNKFSKIYLCFDNDAPGRAAQAAVGQLFDFSKVYIVELNKFKDANEYLSNGDIESFRQAFRKAKRYTPDGIIHSYDDINDVLSDPARKPLARLPFKQLDSMLEGIGTNESILWSGLEGIGKTEVLRALEYHILTTTDHNIGIVHIEESKKATVHGLLTYKMQVPFRREGTDVSQDDKLREYRELTKRDDRVFIYTHYGESDPDTLLGIFRYLVAVCGCKVIFFDHINIVASSMGVDADERRQLDYLSTKLSKLIQELDFNLNFVCHLNDDGRTRGSRNIGQTAHVHVTVSRDLTNADEIERNRLYFMVNKNRPASKTGPGGFAWFDHETGTLKDPDTFTEETFWKPPPEETT